MLRFIEWEIIFCIEMAKYIIAYIICFRQTIKKQYKTIVWSIVSSILFILISRNIMKIENAYICLLFIAVFALYRIIKDESTEKIWKTVIIVLNVTAVDAIMEKILSIFFETNMLSEECKIIIWDFISLACVGATLVWINIASRCFQFRMKQLSNNMVKISVILADICLCLCAMFMFKDSSGDKIYFILAIISFVGVFLLSSQIVKLLDFNNILSEKIVQKNLLNDIQREFYQNILKNEEEIRKYRHDMNNHFMIIQYYLKKNNINAAIDYIEKLERAFCSMSRTRFSVGNDVIDAISGYYLSLVDGFVNVKVNGFLCDELGIDDTELCTIYSNLLKNSIEELQKLNKLGRENLKLNIEFLMGKDFFRIKIINSSIKNEKFNGIKTPTSKKNKINHGIGLGSIKSVVDEQDGRFKLYHINDDVCADVTIPINGHD